MSDDDVAIRLRLLDQQRTSSGLKTTAKDVRGVGKAADDAGGRLSRSAKASDRQSRSFLSLRASGRGASGAIGLVTRGATGLVAAAGGFLALGAASKFAFGEATEAAKVGAQTNAVIRSTGGVAKVTSRHVGDLSGRISDFAGIDDEAIQSGENLLLTFTNVRNEVGKGNKIFDRATLAATNMGVALGTDTRSAALMLGKALNDPAKGYSRLMRSGVSFTDSQVDQIKTLQKNGDLLGAQKIILREVSKEFGGSARAQAQPMDKLKVAIGNLAEAAGGALLPAVNKVVPPVTRFINGVVRGTGAGGRFADKVAEIAGVVRDDALPVILRIAGEIGTHLPGAWHTTTAAISGTVAAIAGIVHGFQQGHTGAVLLVAGIAGLTAAFVAYKIAMAVATAATKSMALAQGALNLVLNANPIGLAVLALIALATAFVIAYKKIGWFHQGVNAVFGWIKANWPLLLGILTGPIGLAVLYIVRHFDQIVGTVKSMPGKIASAATGMWDGIKNAFRSAINWIIGKWNGLHFHIGGKKVLGHTVIPSVDVGTPDIPLLASGGTVRGHGSWITGDAGPEVNTMLPGGGVRVQPLTSPAMTAPSLDGMIELHNTTVLQVDGEQFARVYERVAARAEARR